MNGNTDAPDSSLIHDRGTEAGVPSDQLVARQLDAARAAEQAALARVTALAAVAVRLAGAETVDDLVATVTGGALAVLGSPGGALAVRDGDEVYSVISAELGGAATQASYERLPLSGPLPVSVAARTGRPVFLPDLASSLSFAPEMAGVVAATGAQAYASVPLRTTAGDLGVLTIAWPEAQEFTSGETELIEAFAAQCSQALDRIQVRAAEQSALAALADTVDALQRSLLAVPAQLDHLEAAVRYLPAGRHAQVGGDWYDTFALPDGRTVLVVGDVTGHDSSAAAAMAQVRNLLRGVAHHGNGTPAQVLTGLDLAMRDLQVGTLATAVVASIEQTSRDAVAGERVLRWSNAGHPAPIIVHPDGQVEILERRPEVLLGAAAEQHRTDHTHVLMPGDTVVLYTDGLIERRGVPLDEGTSWLLHALESAGECTVEELCDRLLHEVDPDTDDDIALLVMRTHPESPTVGR